LAFLPDEHPAFEFTADMSGHALGVGHLQLPLGDRLIHGFGVRGDDDRQGIGLASVAQ